MIKSLGFADLFKDEVKISDVVSNTFDYQAVMQGSGAYGNTRFNDIIDQKKRQAKLQNIDQDPKLKVEVVDLEDIREQVETPKE